MPTVTLNKNHFLKLFGKKVSDDTLKDRIAMLGTDLEEINDTEIIVEVFPNRPDFMSEAGLARALRGFMGIETGFCDYKVHKDNEYLARIDPSVKGVREHTFCAVIKNVSLDEEKIVALMQMQEKLHMTHSRKRKNASIGVHDLDTIKFPLEYTTVDENFRFVPLDFTEEMTIKEILTVHPKGKAYAHLVSGKRYPVWLDRDRGVLSFPPIINAAKTTVTTETKNIFIDVTGLDKKATVQALNIIVTALCDDGAKIYSVNIDGFLSPNLKPRNMELSVDYANRLLGLNCTMDEISGLLEKMRYGVKHSDCNKLDVLVPAYRTDILHPIDIVEDVAVAYGYENFKEEMPKIATVGEESREVIFSRKVTDVAVGFGLLECLSYHLANKEHLGNFMRMSDEDVITTANAVNIEYAALRNALLAGLMKILSENTHHEYPQRLFEIGKVVRPDKMKETNTSEVLSLSVVLADTAAEFTEIKALLEGILNGVGIACEIIEASHPSYIAGRCALVSVNGKSIGFVGEIHPGVLNNFNVDVPVAAFEIKLGEIDFS